MFLACGGMTMTEILAQATAAVAGNGAQIVPLIGCGVALASGGEGARPAGGLVLLAWMIAQGSEAGLLWSGLALGLQGSVCLALIALAVQSRPYWILFASAFLLLDLLTRIIESARPGWPADVALKVWAVGVGFALVAGGLRRGATSMRVAIDRI